MRRPSRGFTLIELMIVVAIVGILSSIAIPSFRTYQLRSKQAERGVLTRAMKTSVDEYLTRYERFPNGTALSSNLSTPYAPSYPPKEYKRPFQPSGDWTRLNLQVLGNVYYTYYLYASLSQTTRDFYVIRYGDLDGDTRYNYSYERWLANRQTVSGSQVWVENYTNHDDWFSGLKYF